MSKFTFSSFANGSWSVRTLRNIFRDVSCFSACSRGWLTAGYHRRVRWNNTIFIDDRSVIYCTSSSNRYLLAILVFEPNTRFHQFGRAFWYSLSFTTPTKNNEKINQRSFQYYYGSKYCIIFGFELKIQIIPNSILTN